MTDCRRTLRLPEVADKRLVEIADRRGMQINDAVRLAVGLLHAAQDAADKGEYFGSTPVRENLVTVFVTPI
jgi:hypothetical protein